MTATFSWDNLRVNSQSIVEDGRVFTQRLRQGLAFTGLTLGALVVLAPSASAEHQSSPVGLEDSVTSGAGAITGSVGGLLGGVGGNPGIGGVTDSVSAPQQMFNEILPNGILGG
ncbi:hypothetical protein [Amycolatopsis palatopharyngis]|uniref:hypothetical protein n=1 Tax=Amycolatopsis palatopharyngis TaxID=187982 RepID=UPI0013BE9A78|nr:hypothetical protein [Amycolatopsis palatopharyngis]